MKDFWKDFNSKGPYVMMFWDIVFFLTDKKPVSVLNDWHILVGIIACFWLIHNIKKELTRVKESVK